MKARQASPTLRRAPGFSLIELLVSMAIGLVITLAIATVMVDSERDRRGSTAVNDISQSGSYAAYVLDRQIRSAGSGFAQRWSEMVGCTVYAQNQSGQLLPRTSAFASMSPFFGWTSPAALPIPLVPVVVGKDLAGSGGDLLLVETGTAGAVEDPAALLPGISGGQLRLNNTLGYRGGDVLLLADSVASVAGKCLLQEARSGFSGSSAQVLPVGGNHYSAATVGGVSLTSYATGSTAFVAQLGNLDLNNPPQFTLIGVGANSTLYSTDLLPASGAINDVGQPIADGVVEMRALYGIVDSTNGLRFVSPGSPGFTANDLTAGPSAQAALQRIRAIRLGLILRTPIGEQKAIYPANATIGLFAGLTDANTGASLASAPRSIGGGTGPYYRYRTVELTIPMRNIP